jgi:phage terminase large subunit
MRSFAEKSLRACAFAIVIPYTPRPQFEAYHDRTERFAKIVAHRRFGKTVGCINDKIKAALTNTRQFRRRGIRLCCPDLHAGQGRRVGLSEALQRAHPGIKISESELWVEYPNGARIRLYGADNYDRMRGFIMTALRLMSRRRWTLGLGLKSFGRRYRITADGDVHRNAGRA